MTARPRPDARSSGPPHVVLSLYITGLTPRSSRAVEHVRALCDDVLADHYELRVIDVYQQPALAARDQIVAAPTLIKRLPLPQRRVIGDMSNRKRVLECLSLTHES